jgi:hypothetical protein
MGSFPRACSSSDAHQAREGRESSFRATHTGGPTVGGLDGCGAPRRAWPPPFWAREFGELRDDRSAPRPPHVARVASARAGAHLGGECFSLSRSRGFFCDILLPQCTRRIANSYRPVCAVPHPPLAAPPLALSCPRTLSPRARGSGARNSKAKKPHDDRHSTWARGCGVTCTCTCACDVCDVCVKPYVCVYVRVTCTCDV